MTNKCRHNFVFLSDLSLEIALRAAVVFIITLIPSVETNAQNVIPKSHAAVDPSSENKVIIDTDIGYDIDDAFALALALDSPELEILGITTTSGDTLARARIVDRMLGESGHANITVAVGIRTTGPKSAPDLLGLQRRFGESGQYTKASHPDAVEFILEKIRQYPGEITLVAIGPLSNVAAMIDKDPESFRRLKRIVMMGGQIGPAEDSAGRTSNPTPEYNIVLDIPAARKVFESGIPIYVMPIDSTGNLALDEIKRERIFATATPLTESVGLLYLLWNYPTPILYDAMAVTYVLKPELCPVTPVHLTVDDTGMTLVQAGSPNAQVCLHSNPSRFFDYFMARVTGEHESSVTLASDTPNSP